MFAFILVKKRIKTVMEKKYKERINQGKRAYI